MLVSQNLSLLAGEVSVVSARCSQLGSLNGEADGFGDAISVLGVDLEEVRNESLLDVSAAFAEAAGDVSNDTGTLGVVEDLAEELTRLFVVGVGVSVLVTSDDSVVAGSVPGLGRILNGGVRSGVRLVVDFALLISVNAHLAVTDHVRDASAVGAVDRDLLVVGTESVSVSVGIREETSLQHLIERSFDSGNQVRGREGTLFGFGVEVLGVAVENKSADIH